MARGEISIHRRKRDQYTISLMEKEKGEKKKQFAREKAHRRETWFPRERTQ